MLSNDTIDWHCTRFTCALRQWHFSTKTKAVTVGEKFAHKTWHFESVDPCWKWPCTCKARTAHHLDGKRARKSRQIGHQASPLASQLNSNAPQHYIRRVAPVNFSAKLLVTVCVCQFQIICFRCINFIRRLCQLSYVSLNFSYITLKLIKTFFSNFSSVVKNVLQNKVKFDFFSSFLLKILDGLNHDNWLSVDHPVDITSRNTWQRI